MISPDRLFTTTPHKELRELGWQVFLTPADRGLLFGLRTTAPADEKTGDAIVEQVRWLLPESEYGLRIVRTYAAPGVDAQALRTYLSDAIAHSLPRRGERLLLLLEGFDMLDRADRLSLAQRAVRCLNAG